MGERTGGRAVVELLAHLTEDGRELIWPVAVALVDGDFDVAGVLAEFSNADVAAVAPRAVGRISAAAVSWP